MTQNLQFWSFCSGAQNLQNRSNFIPLILFECMASPAAQYCLAGRMWPVGNRLESHARREWEKTWQMEFNADKCYVIKITHSKNPSTYDYKLGTTSLQETTSHTYLGVTSPMTLDGTSMLTKLLHLQTTTYTSCVATFPLVQENPKSKLMQPLLDITSPRKQFCSLGFVHTRSNNQNWSCST